MRLLVVNPNMDARVTAWLAEEAARAAAGWTVEAVNAESGLAALETPEHVARAGAAVARAIAAARPDAALIGAFGDPGLAEARALGLPVAGLGESGLLAAGQAPFGVVTLGEAMRAPTLARIAAMGLSARLVGLEILPGAIADYVADREGRLPELARAAEALAATGAETVLLGGAPFAGQARRLGAYALDGVASAVAALKAAVG